MRALFPITLFLISAPLIPRLAAQPRPVAAEKLQHALRLADLYNWADAGPDFADAERLFLAAGDQRNALYARLGVIRSNSDRKGTVTILERLEALSQHQGFTRELADAQSELSEIFRESGDLAKAEQFAKSAADSTQAGGDMWSVPQRLKTLAEVEVLQGRYADADDAYDRASAFIDSLIGNYSSVLAKTAVISASSEVYTEHFSLVARQLHQLPKAYSIVEQVRGRVLADLLMSGSARPGVYDDGPAHAVGIRPGDTLIAVDGVACQPSVMPRFLLGQTYSLTLSSPAGGDCREVQVAVPARKGTKERPPIVEPKSLAHSMIPPNVGVLRIAYFSGSLGMRFTRALDAAIKDLKDRGADRLIVDLRGNIGGSLGFARLASYLCPGKIPIGNSLTPKRLRSGYNRESLPQVPMPGNKIEAVMTLGRFAFRDKSVVLMTQGLGPQPFHGKIVLLVNEWTNSAAEMVTSFAVEHDLAAVVGTKTAGNVLGAANFKVGSGYWVRLPIFGWYTSRGESLDGKGVMPHISVDVDPCQLISGVDQQMDKALEVVGTLGHC